ncbi:tRNA/tmRNA/rRNA uracil-C5-methylase (TrmA/RlmC/RlmD family) [Nocardioides luteus]|uniref:23S rRNA methyltransferase n=1 Tax=Nocardioides luteus TaxID=1844 RepID=A0ABQ5SZ32_9ACTN|nr:TRAM domain-containing protein [Nocardioides luteus]MDR7310772.1 tRNA/tmRNA/rRNA uracil-C5-methylase (TrmA/RlmC/RlmD family) [Nocardioides luteus]GGR40718.1 23S rRNA methyltransferase [Nocardioides luteus]GLJ69448.1 23S rRNA methyltransferase [Nocardioides luteus]
MSRGNRGRRPRPKAAKGESYAGRRFEVEIGPVAHGGHFVARLQIEDASRVVFVRHALPGERAVVEITEGRAGDRFWRGDAVEVLEPAPERLVPPCPYAGPGLCGGCDFQHVALPAQRELKASVLREQLVRLGGLAATDPLVADLSVEAVPGDVDGLRWRTRQRYARMPDGGRAMRKYRSHEVIPIADCLIAAPDAREPAPGTVVEKVAVDGSEHAFKVAADGFWQVHPGAPTALVSAVLSALSPAPGESVLDLYAGVGLFSAFLADRVGPAGRVVAIEGDPTASSLSVGNVPAAEVSAGDVATVLGGLEPGPFDLVVLDPPREGARRAVVEAVAARAPRKVAYVACDPAALARDVAIFAEHGYHLRSLRAFDLFPMTHHVEAVALLTR